MIINILLQFFCGELFIPFDHLSTGDESRWKNLCVYVSVYVYTSMRGRVLPNYIFKKSALRVQMGKMQPGNSYKICLWVLVNSKVYMSAV